MRKQIVLLLTCVIVLNCGSSLSAVEFQDRSAFEQALKAESSVLGLFSVASVPLNLVSVLIKSNVPLLQSLTTVPKAQDKREKKHPRNTSSDFSLTCGYPTGETIGSGSFSPVYGLSNTLFSFTGPNGFDRSRQFPGQYPFVYLFLLMYLVLLAKSNLPWAMIISIKQINSPTVYNGRVFNLGRVL